MRAVHNLFYSVAETGFVLTHQMATQHVKHLRPGALDDGHTS
jgi:hypothetical protein